MLEHTGMTVVLLEAMGFLINYPKSQLTPEQSAQFLGCLVDSNSMKLSPPMQAKVKNITQEAKRLMGAEEVSTMQLS